MATAAKTIEGFEKPFKNFPLTKHASKGWYKKVNGKARFICPPCHHEKALEVWFEKRKTLLPPDAKVDAPPPISALPFPAPESAQPCPSLMVSELRDQYLVFKEQQFKAGGIVARSIESTAEAVNRFVKKVNKPTHDLTVKDFADYRHDLSMHFKSLYSLERHILQVRGMFRWAVETEILSSLPRWNKSFNKPSPKEKNNYEGRLETKRGKKKFTRQEVLRLLRMTKTKPELRAMIFLAINCGIGNTDLGLMPEHVLDLDKGILDYRRHKNGQMRRAILWPETVKAIRRVLACRPKAANPQHNDLVFLTKSGRPWVRVRREEVGGESKTVKVDYIALYFRDLKKTANVKHGFYALRHTFRTISDEVLDQHAIDLVMGHKLPGSRGSYVQGIKDSRLRKIADYVRWKILKRKREKPTSAHINLNISEL